MAAVFASCVIKNPARYHFVLNYGKGMVKVLAARKNMQQASDYCLLQRHWRRGKSSK